MSIEQHNILAIKKQFPKYLASQQANGMIYLNSKLLKDSYENDKIVDGIVKGEYNHWKHENVKALEGVSLGIPAGKIFGRKSRGNNKKNGG